MDKQWRIIHTLLRLSQTIEYQLEILLRPFGIGLTDLRLMTIISWMTGSSQKLLARKMGLSQVVISTRLDKLERMGFIGREQVQGRLVAVDLTAQGSQILKVMMNVIEVSAPVLALGRLDNCAEDRVVDTLERWMQLMQRPADEPPQINPIPLRQPEDPVSTVRSRLEEARSALDRALIEQNYRMTEAIQRLSDELDTLVEAYVALRRGHSQRGS